MADDLASKVLDRYKMADAEHNPDPLTYKAFLSEFKQGEKAGAEMGTGPGRAMNELVVVEE